LNSRKSSREYGSEESLMKCQEAIGYLFRREGLLRKALTHSSVKDDKHPSNERFEFLGDAILGMGISEYLFSMLPGNDEGELTRVKSVVVSGESLSRLGLELGLDRFLMVGKGIRLKKEIPRSLVANTVEAVIAAVYLDRGMEAARHFVLDHLHGYVDEVLRDEHREKNYKSLLQQYSQRTFSATPTYHVHTERGPDHSKHFRVAAVVGSHEFPSGRGLAKKEAEQDAARLALEVLANERNRGKRRGGKSRRSEDEKADSGKKTGRKKSPRKKADAPKEEAREPERKKSGRKKSAEKKPARKKKASREAEPREAEPERPAAGKRSSSGRARSRKPAEAQRERTESAEPAAEKPARGRGRSRKPVARRKAASRKSEPSDRKSRDPEPEAPPKRSRRRRAKASSDGDR